jgi:hypothetical protein
MRWVEDMFNPQKKVVETQVDSPLNKEVGDYIQLQKEAKEDYNQNSNLSFLGRLKACSSPPKNRSKALPPKLEVESLFNLSKGELQTLFNLSK